MVDALDASDKNESDKAPVDWETRKVLARALWRADLPNETPTEERRDLWNTSRPIYMKKAAHIIRIAAREDLIIAKAS